MLKSRLINWLVKCDIQNGVITHSSMSPSSSIEEIAEFLSKKIENKIEKKGE